MFKINLNPWFTKDFWDNEVKSTFGKWDDIYETRWQNKFKNSEGNPRLTSDELFVAFTIKIQREADKLANTYISESGLDFPEMNPSDQRQLTLFWIDVMEHWMNSSENPVLLNMLSVAEGEGQFDVETDENYFYIIPPGADAYIHRTTFYQQYIGGEFAGEIDSISPTSDLFKEDELGNTENLKGYLYSNTLFNNPVNNAYIQRSAAEILIEQSLVTFENNKLVPIENDIATNVIDIATNEADIETNATNIATNANAIVVNQNAITVNQNKIALNTARLTVVSEDVDIPRAGPGISALWIFDLSTTTFADEWIAGKNYEFLLQATADLSVYKVVVALNELVNITLPSGNPAQAFLDGYDNELELNNVSGQFPDIEVRLKRITQLASTGGGGLEEVFESDVILNNVYLIPGTSQEALNLGQELVNLELETRAKQVEDKTQYWEVDGISYHNTTGSVTNMISDTDFYISGDGDVDINSNDVNGISLRNHGTEVARFRDTVSVISSPLDMVAHKIERLATPTVDTDASTKKYVDDSTGGLSGTLIGTGTTAGAQASITLADNISNYRLIKVYFKEFVGKRCYSGEALTSMFNSVGSFILTNSGESDFYLEYITDTSVKWFGGGDGEPVEVYGIK